MMVALKSNLSGIMQENRPLPLCLTLSQFEKVKLVTVCNFVVSHLTFHLKNRSKGISYIYVNMFLVES